MTSEILTELKSLSGKVDAIQNEISHLYKIFVDHLSTRHGQVPQGQDLQQKNPNTCRNEHVGSVERLASNLNGLEGSVNCQDQSVVIESPVCPGLQKQVVDEPSRSADEKCTRTSHILTKKLQNKERTVQFSQKNFKECREECLRKSLQQNIVLLVDNLPYSENDILDMLIEKECLTETECSDLMNNGSRKDRVRNLVRMMKGRTYKVMKTFIGCVKTLHPEVAECIWQVYEKLVKNRKNYNRQCTFCVLKRSTDLKFIADHTWSIGAISDELYDEIVDGKTDKETLWTKLAEECNKSEVRQTVLRKLSEALMTKCQYRELVMKLSKASNLRCACVKIDLDLTNLPASERNGVPDILVNDSEENSTVSPTSTPSCRSFADENDITSDNDSFSVNENETYLLSPWTAENDNLKHLYTSCFGIRKSSTYALHSAVTDELRTSRSNSFGKSAGQRGNLKALRQRRASMFT